jgi:cytochrome c-type biogenesis protein CcmE
MKKIHIFGITVIAIAIGIIVSTAGDASTYVNFTQAEELAMSGDEGSIHVVGKLKKDASGQIMEMAYQPELDPNYFVFTLLDNDSRQQKVVYRSPKPLDFDRSEQVVVIGRMEKNHFEAEKILLKCPSKYNNEKLETTEYQASKL